MFSSPTDESLVYQLLQKELQGVSPQQVLGVDEETKVELCLQFHVPKKQETTYPRVIKKKDQNLLVEHGFLSHHEYV